MSKRIIKAINVIINNPDKISNVSIEQSGQGLYFLFLGKQKWGMYYNDSKDEYILHYYPGDTSLNNIMNLSNNQWEITPHVTYCTGDFKTKEALETFKDLYNLLKEKSYNIDEVIDDILKLEKNESNEIHF